jgi:hypothetical protein
MSITMIRRAVIAGFAVLAIALLTVPIALRAANTSSVLEACINPGNGGMRLVDASTTCHDNETRVQWNVEGPAGPPGPAGPTGPAGPPGPSGSGGPPFVWVCTPGAFYNAGNSTGNIYVFNGSASTASIAVNFLDNTGNNLAGVTVPGASPAATYPGEAGATTVPLAAAHTRNIPFATPVMGGPGFDGVTNVAISIRVTSDQPITVGSVLVFSGFIPVPCSLLPK